ncbi:MAG: restriction endonuclease [Chloroflexi bacterium]|nr:MAG: restriction endonuclease [Chloroflexota bacterium]
MKIGGVYSIKSGVEVIETCYATQLAEIQKVIAEIDALQSQKNHSDFLNYAFDRGFQRLGWQSKVHIQCNYTADYYTPDYTAPSTAQAAQREMEFVNNRLGVEVQFGRYASVVYDICAKMTIFHKVGLIDAGIQILPLQELADKMPTDALSFEQIVWDLEQRGVSNIDIPVMILGIRA